MEIFIALIGEGVEAWRPVEAERIDNECFRISGVGRDHTSEVWEFTEGELVRCEGRTFSGGSSGLVATRKVERPSFTQPFLACYDYGQGGIWSWVEAESAAQIREAYPELTVLDRMPMWMTPEVLQSIQSRSINESSLRKWLDVLKSHRKPMA